MPRVNDAWGLEVGANAIKALHLVREGEEVRVVDFDILPFKSLLTSPDVNVDEAIQQNLDQFLARHDVGRSPVFVSVAGHAAFARFAKLPPVEPKKIAQIVTYEAQQQIPFPIDQVEWDYQIFAQPDSPDVEVGIFAITKEKVGQILNNYRAVGLSVAGLTLSPVAVFNAIVFDQDLGPESDGLVVVDIGTVSTDLIVIDGGDLWLRTLPIGGNNFTEALVRAFKLSFAKAEKLKREAATSQHARQIFQAMRPVFSDLVQEVQRSLGYYQSLNRDAKLTRLMGVGSTFRLPGLLKFMKQQLQIEVFRPEGFRKLSVSGPQAAVFAEHALNMATAYGLALQGLGLEKISANILPKSVVRQRVWRSKQPMFAVAAAAMAIAVGAGAFRWWLDSTIFRAGASSVQVRLAALSSEAKAKIQQLQNIETNADPRQEIEHIRRVLDYRDLWPKILEDIASAAASVGPQPVLLTADYEKHQQIPRRERRVLYFTSLKATYGTAAGPATVPMPGPAGPYGYGPYGYGPGPGPGMPYMGEFEYGPEAMMVQQGTPASEQPEKPRSFLIELTGWTPYNKSRSEHGAVLCQQFVNWLQKNAERPDRPYKIVAKQSDVRVSQRGRASGQPTAGGPVPEYGPGPYGPGGWRGYGPEGMGEGMPSLNIGEVRQLLPMRPLMDEPSADDWVFTISFTVEVLPREAARAAMLQSAPVPPTTPADGPEEPGPSKADTPAASESQRTEERPG